MKLLRSFYHRFGIFFAYLREQSMEGNMSGRTTLWLLFLLPGLGLAEPTYAEPLPEGNSGIAARYPGDVGIGSDSAVLFADDFESYSSAAGLTGRWNEAYHTANIRIATEPGNVISGRQALEFTVPQASSEVSNTAVKYVSPEQDVLFLRYYAKYDAGFNVLGSSHNGSTISARYCCPGVRADGYNKFLVSYEAWRGETATANPGELNSYIYHPDQRDIWGDHFFPTGTVLPFSYLPFNFGPEFVSRPDVLPVLGRWYSYELMVKANTPGLRDGRVAFWLDGKLIADFPNLRLRETSALKIDRFTIDLHVKSNTLSVARKWYDNVVAATSYIGPMVSNASPKKPNPPTDIRVVP
jgi:hypothetical protein